ncbi:MAG: segregation/condensation protein A [Saprospiraceae bacterium]|nr:segregation/condensation protein A [Saprospiraceae bacterium]MBK6564296.1 segregation/condensation protein A [Saprospiraceae bacterium]MBK6782466.1 segregation/condensation protein A [Saprospiraceae bacterium]MBK7524019.1 segregation/condensation protein A [Saprospiraceae bacterium]MBK8372075.1 segregation/condensation protein A [Saprospiraceae bacterium]
MMNTYQIVLPQFEGPFDLLLFFIERDELDIHDIPIAKITTDFLDYIRHLESLNIDIASEFILVAASLMRIKAKMLIPRKELDDLGNEIDPRGELVQKLLEYKKYKEVLHELSHMEDVRNEKFVRGNLPFEFKELSEKALVDIELESLSLYKLFQTFQKVLKRFEEDSNKPVPKIVNYAYSVEDQQTYIRQILISNKRIPFDKLFLTLENRMHAVVTFLALLELLNLQQLIIIQGEGINNFWISSPKQPVSM